MTMISRRFRYDPTAPVLSVIDTLTKDEANENVTFATDPDPMLGGGPRTTRSTRTTARRSSSAAASAATRAIHTDTSDAAERAEPLALPGRA